MEPKHAKVIIIGSGPAGYTAAIYAARANLGPILLSGVQKGGQLTITTLVENYPGFAEPINGPFLMEQMEKQAKNVGAEVIDVEVQSVDFSSRPFKLRDSMGIEYLADSVIICSGAQAKWLGLESEQKYVGFGVSGCATCDGVFYKGKKVLVIGGGNTAAEEALYMTNHATEVRLIHRRDSLRADSTMQSRLFKHPKIKIVWDTAIYEVIGKENPREVTGAILQNLKTGEKEEIKVDGIFVAIGHKPNSDLFKTWLDLDKEGYILTTPGSTKTNVSGVFAAGDVQDKTYRQAVTAAGTGCMASLEAERFLNAKV